jgi:Zn-dependent peptidase ImmA (M78 family)
MDQLCDKLGYQRGFFLRPVLTKDEAPEFWRSNANATQIARERCHPRLRWLKGITIYEKEYLEFPKLDLPEFRIPNDFRDLRLSEIDRFAQETRNWWNFGVGPIPDLVLEMENSGIVTARIDVAAETLDAFSQWSSVHNTPFVILGRDKASAVRSRFDAAHELAHLLLHRRVDRRRVNSSPDWKILEQQAHRFAAAFLLPAKPFADELWAPSLDGMLARKDRWKVSIAMMIVRSEHLGLINQDQVKRLWINYNRRGWRGEEPLDAILKPEQPRLLRRGIETIVEEGVRTRGQIVDDLCLPAREIENLSGLPNRYLSGQQADIKAFPRLKSASVQSESQTESSAEIVPIFGRKKSD